MTDENAAATAQAAADAATAAGPAKKAAAKRPAKKAAATKPKAEKVAVLLIGTSHGAPAGTRRRVTTKRAESLVARNLARYETP